MKFLRIREWAKYQHYRNRNPPWIKLHQELMTSVVWVTGDDASRTLAIACMMLAARTGNKIPLDRDFIQRSAYFKKRPDIRPLVECGFAEIVDEPDSCVENTPLTNDASEMLAELAHDASTPLAECYSREREREREEVEKEKNSVRPTLEEVSQYCQERQNQVDPSKWFDYYSSNGWRVGKNPMKDWRAAVRTWEKNGFGGPFNDGNKKSTGRDAESNPNGTGRANTQATRAFSNIAAVATLLGGSDRVAPGERVTAVANNRLTDGTRQTP